MSVVARYGLSFAHTIVFARVISDLASLTPFMVVLDIAVARGVLFHTKCQVKPPQEAET